MLENRQVTSVHELDQNKKENIEARVKPVSMLVNHVPVEVDNKS